MGSEVSTRTRSGTRVQVIIKILVTASVSSFYLLTSGNFAGA